MAVTEEDGATYNGDYTSILVFDRSDREKVSKARCNDNYTSIDRSIAFCVMVITHNQR